MNAPTVGKESIAHGQKSAAVPEDPPQPPQSTEHMESFQFFRGLNEKRGAALCDEMLESERRVTEWQALGPV